MKPPWMEPQMGSSQAVRRQRSWHPLGGLRPVFMNVWSAIAM